MCQPKRWFLGLIPLLGLLLVAGFMKQGGVETDLAGRSATIAQSSGVPWAKVTVSGRDAVVTGEAPLPESQGLALTAVERTFGVRNVANRTTVLPEAKPFVLSAMRDGAKVTLTGFVPSEGERGKLVAAAKAAFPGATIVDETKIARGAPATFAAASAFGLGELAKLSPGTLQLSDSTLSLTGRALDLPKFAEVRGKLAALPAGLALGKGLGAGDILPPVIKPFRFEAEKKGAAIVLSGLVPSEAARTGLVTAARALGNVEDRLQLAEGAPGGDWTGAATRVVAELKGLSAGKAGLNDANAWIEGAGLDGVNEQSVRAGLAALPAGFTLVSAAIQPGAIRPYLFNAVRTSGLVDLSGFVPDEASRKAIVDATARFFEFYRVRDDLKVGPGAPKDYVAAIRGGLQELSRLAPGGSLGVSDTKVTLKGMALFENARDQIGANFRRAMPAGFQPGLELGVLPPPPPVANLSECDVLYRDALAGGTIRFKTGSAELSEESLGLIDRLAIVTLRCAQARIEIGGHTDSDGAAAANMDLSQRRANAVASHFLRAGVPAAQLEPVGYGPNKPLAPNDSAENKAKNRRIEFVVKTN